MATTSDFESFLKDINPSKTTIDEVSRLHNNLRAYLSTHDDYSSVYRDSYLSGSYAKHTFIRPKKDSDSCDVDVVVETSHSTDDDPAEVLEELRGALVERDAYSSAVVQSHSVGIDMASMHIDVVPLAGNSKGELFIGSVDDETWTQTDPKQHKVWSTEVNREYGGNYKPLVKMMKWWRRDHCPENRKFPKGIVLEKIIADNLPDVELGVEGILIQAMENLASAFDEDLQQGKVPFVEDPAIQGNDLAAGYEAEDFKAFAGKLHEHLALLAESGTSNDTWRQILGNSFPGGKLSSNSSYIGVERNTENAREAACAVKHRKALDCPFLSGKPRVTVVADVVLPDGTRKTVQNDGAPLPKGCTIVYRALRAPVKGNARILWQVTNTGEEAMRVCPRGGFEKPNEGAYARREETAYTGKHFVQFFVVKNGVCVQHSNPFFINVE